MRYGTCSTRERSTTEAVRRVIQRNQESLRTLAKRYGVNQKTVAKWKKEAVRLGLSDGSQDTALNRSDERRRSNYRRFS